MTNVGIIAFILLVPVAASAASSSVQSSTSATADTGGNTAESGGTVKTGNANASAQTTVIQEEGESTVYIKTEANGNIHEETVIDSEGSVGVSVEATPEKTEVNIQKGNTTTTHTYSASSTASTTATVDVQADSETGFVARVAGWVVSLLTFFRW